MYRKHICGVWRGLYRSRSRDFQEFTRNHVTQPKVCGACVCVTRESVESALEKPPEGSRTLTHAVYANEVYVN